LGKKHEEIARRVLEIAKTLINFRFEDNYMGYMLDNAIYFVSSIILIIWCFRQNVDFVSKFIYAITFVILNSSYNIMIKSVGHHVLVVPRNFLYHKEIFGQVVPVDLIAVLFVAISLKEIPKSISGISRSVLMRDIGLFALGTISYIINQGYSVLGVSAYFRYARGLLYLMAFFFVTRRYLRQGVKILFPLSIIMLGSGASCLVVPLRDLWVRYSHRVLIIDQESAYTISILLILIYFFLLLERKRKKIKIPRLPILVGFTLFLFQYAWCTYKTAYVYAIIFAACVMYFVKGHRKGMIVVFTCFFVISPLVINSVVRLFTSTPIFTRLNQITEYTEYISNGENSLYAFLFGSGIGTPYYTPNLSTDTGEVKGVDLLANPHWKISLQTPILSVFKDTGIIGMFVFIISTVSICIRIGNMLRNIYIEFSEFTYQICETLALGTMLIFIVSIRTVYDSTSAASVFNGFVLARFCYSANEIRKTQNHL
jgi:hypothetical protein